MDKRSLEDLLRQAYNDVVRALVTAEEMRPGAIPGHAERVASLSVAIAQRMGWDEESLLELRRAAALHDIGKIAVDSVVASKLGRLTEPELAQMRLHAELAERILSRVARLRGALPMVRHHHERWDGHGYPDGLRGEQIPAGARIIAVAETFDVLTTQVSWRQTMDEPEAIEEIRRCSGTQFEPAAVQAFIDVVPLISFVRMEAQ